MPQNRSSFWVDAVTRIKTLYAERLEHLVHERSERIDQLTGVVDQLKCANQRLGLENEILTAMIAAPPLNAIASQ
jgi:hypothetical protein